MIVEYGPGTGAITHRILKRLARGAQVIAIEANPALAEHLRANNRDRRLVVVNGSATDVQVVLAKYGISGADYIISGIPFSTMSHEQRLQIISATHRALKPGGKFLVYQFTRSILPYLRHRFQRIERGFELRNVLPAQLFYCAA